jgi:hypothetical protein
MHWRKLRMFVKTGLMVQIPKVPPMPMRMAMRVVGRMLEEKCLEDILRDQVLTTRRAHKYFPVHRAGVNIVHLSTASRRGTTASLSRSWFGWCSPTSMASGARIDLPRRDRKGSVEAVKTPPRFAKI